MEQYTYWGGFRRWTEPASQPEEEGAASCSLSRRFVTACEVEISLFFAFICSVAIVFLWCALMMLWFKYPAFFGNAFLVLMVIALTVAIYHKFQVQP